MVSALNGMGVKDMVRTLKDDMGFRADLWVVGAQNGESAELCLSFAIEHGMLLFCVPLRGCLFV
jgi:hypothetical protein